MATVWMHLENLILWERSQSQMTHAVELNKYLERNNDFQEFFIKSFFLSCGGKK